MTPIEILKAKRNAITAKTYLAELIIYLDYETQLSRVRKEHPDLFPFIQTRYYYEFLSSMHKVSPNKVATKINRIGKLTPSERIELRHLANQVLKEIKQA